MEEKITMNVLAVLASEKVQRNADLMAVKPWECLLQQDLRHIVKEDAQNGRNVTLGMHISTNSCKNGFG